MSVPCACAIKYPFQGCGPISNISVIERSEYVDRVVSFESELGRDFALRLDGGRGLRAFEGRPPVHIKQAGARAVRVTGVPHRAADAEVAAMFEVRTRRVFLRGDTANRCARSEMHIAGLQMPYCENLVFETGGGARRDGPYRVL